MPRTRCAEIIGNDERHIARKVIHTMKRTQARVATDESAKPVLATTTMNNADFDNTQEDFGAVTLTGKSTFGKFCFNMRERLMSRVSKYGALNKNYPKKVHALDSMLRRLDLYVATGNVEYLVDAANFAYIEHAYPSHPDAHSGPTDVNAPGLVVRTDGV